MSEIDLGPVRHALETARERGFREVELELGDIEFEAKLEGAPRPKQESPAQVAEPQEAPEPAPFEIASPCVGYFKAGPQPLQAGREVKAGDIVGIVTALGIANEIECKASGQVVEVTVSEGSAVEYGQVIALVKVDA